MPSNTPEQQQGNSDCEYESHHYILFCTTCLLTRGERANRRGPKAGSGYFTFFRIQAGLRLQSNTARTWTSVPSTR